jgi:hypothetical protein
MPPTRVRFVSLLEWAVAAAMLAAVAAAGSFAVRHARPVHALQPVIARQTLPDPPVPAGVPSRAVSVPVLLLADGTAVRVGEGLEAVTQRLGGALETRPHSLERSPNGERVTRFYAHAGSRFVLVFEPFERDRGPRLAAIYLP